MFISIFSYTKVKAETVVSKTAINTSSNQTNLNWDSFYRFVAITLKYPNKARKKGVSGKSQISFEIKNGKVDDLSNDKRLGYGCDEELMRAFLAYQGFDKSFDGKYAFVASFAFDGESRIITKEEVKPLEGFTNLNEVVILTYRNQKRDAEKAEAISLPPPIPAATDSVLNIMVIERKPEFAGGLQKFYEYSSRFIIPQKPYAYESKVKFLCLLW